MHVTSPFTAPELPLVNITTSICPSFPHSKWELKKNMVIGREKEKEKEKREGHHPTAPRSSEHGLFGAMFEVWGLVVI
jgi:hypothetical protein